MVYIPENVQLSERKRNGGAILHDALDIFKAEETKEEKKTKKQLGGI